MMVLCFMMMLVGCSSPKHTITCKITTNQNQTKEEIRQSIADKLEMNQRMIQVTSEEGNQYKLKIQTILDEDELIQELNEVKWIEDTQIIYELQMYQ